MRKQFMKGMAYVLCTALAVTTVPSWAVYAENGEVSGGTVKIATASEAKRKPVEVKEESKAEPKPERNTEVKTTDSTKDTDSKGSDIKETTELNKIEKAEKATPSQAERNTDDEVINNTEDLDDIEETKGMPTKEETTQKATASEANSIPFVTSLMAVKAMTPKEKVSNSIGDIWDSWSGKTSFEFLDGGNGEGTEEKPFRIKNKAQLMGLSELAAMGMTVQDAEGVDYAGDYSNCYFALSSNIDLQGIDWIPIGFYRDSTENAGEVPSPFSGHFDGNGHTIKNLKLKDFASYNNVGLFGAVKDATIHDVTIIPDSSKIKGNDRTGIVVGYAEDSKIHDVEVRNAYISSTGVTGGIAGEISGSVIENTTCEKVMIDATDGTDVIYVGGIAGNASDSYIIDCEVSTGTGTTARIQGTGYVGGIVGYQNATDIFNTHVSGTIGGYHSTAIGGITGKYASGKLKVARFEGTIGNSQLGSLAREGTFIGTREGAATNFNYIDDVAYLFADTASKISANICGSEISDDNDYTYDAHVGYWHTGDLYYTLVQGGATKTITDRYFYEALEKGILSITDEESGDYTLDHFAPNKLGRPVRGYLLTVSQIDTVANGQNYYDIASIEVRGSSQYSKTINKEHRGAIAAGSAVSITTAPKNTDTEKFQMTGNPYYIDINGKKKSATYSNSRHSYTFTMPTENVNVSANYKKVAVSIKVNPDTYTFEVTQTRTGNRKNPVKTTEIRNQEGKLIARYINGTLENGTQVQPVNIKAIIDANNDVADNKVKWSIDDPQLIGLAKNSDEKTDGYTEKSASLSLNLGASFFTEIIEEAEKKQAKENYQYKILNTIYGAGHQNGGVAVLTAQTRPSSSFEGKPCTANCKINVTFQMIDNTLVGAEGATLNKQTLEYTVTRTLTGDRTNATETITVTAPQSLTATFTPDFFSRKEVTWTSSDPAVVSVSQDEEAYREALILGLKDAKWIRDIIATDNGRKRNDKYAKISGSGSRKSTITVNGTDNLGNHATASCEVTVNFTTKDQTRVVPEGITLDKEALSYHLSHQKAGDIHSQTVKRTGFETKKVTATVLPIIEGTEQHKPYDRSITWTSTDPEAVTVDQEGNVIPIDGAPWIKDALSKAPYQAEKSVEITAITKDGKKAASCIVSLAFHAECIEVDRQSERFNLILTKTGRRNNPVLTWSGLEGKKLNASIYTKSKDKKNILWSSSNSGIVTVDQDGNIKPVVLNEKKEVVADWIKKSMEHNSNTGVTTGYIYAKTIDGKLSDPVKVTLNYKVIDNTYRRSSSGGGGGGGSSSGGSGSFGHSIGVTANGNTNGPAAPAGAVTGTWTQTTNGKWIFASGRTYTDEWAYISNPYANKEQEKVSWFRFDKDGFMVTGWQNIEGTWYYFNPVSDGTRGKLLTNTTTPDGYMVNEKGQWIQ